MESPAQAGWSIGAFLNAQVAACGLTSPTTKISMAADVELANLKSRDKNLEERVLLLEASPKDVAVKSGGD